MKNKRGEKNMEDIPRDELGNCAGCGVAYSFYLKIQFHKKGCPYADKGKVL